MSKVLILSKTRMANNNVCVGAIDLESSKSIRLLDRNGHHESIDICEYNIYDAWEIDYVKHHGRLSPHNEDVAVISKKKIGVKNKNLSLRTILINNKAKLFSGDLQSIFDGCLKCTQNGAMYINEENTPNYSTCFWISDKPMSINRFNNQIKYVYQDPLYRFGKQIKFVGLSNNIKDIIPANTLIRFSLAHWWKPDNGGIIELRCYLQLSGIFEEIHE
ncbi:MAG: hypothetical protein SNJ29_11655 [Rikenellaceae bacterium]